MNELINSLWCEKYRPQIFDDLILENKGELIKQLESGLPSFIFTSSQPGTGKTSTAKIIAHYLEADLLIINASDERGIDVIRDRVTNFARSMSSNPDSKRCVFLDEAEGLTKQAQESMKNLMEEYSDNCFFIFTTNDISKIIEPIQSRCHVVNFERPNKADIIARLEYICEQEKLGGDIECLVDYYYPDMRKMINVLQDCKINNKPWSKPVEQFTKFLDFIIKKDVDKIYQMVYSDFDYVGFNGWMFRYLFDNYAKFGFEKCRQISLKLADTEKAWNMNVNKEVVFISNILDIMKVI